MKKIVLLLTIAMSLSMSAFAQYEAKMEQFKVVKGSVTVDGKTTEGYIKKQYFKWDEVKSIEFWQLQKGCDFIEKSVFENTEKIKGKNFVSYDAKTCQSFVYDGIEFEVVKFSDMKAAGTGMIPKKMFLRKLNGNDKVQFYLYWESVPKVEVIGVNSMSKSEVAHIVNYPSLVYALPSGDRAKGVEFLNAKKELPNCTTILNKIENKEYRENQDAGFIYQLCGYDGNIDDSGMMFRRNANILMDVKNGICE